MTAQSPRVGLIMEQALRHVTYTRNLQTAYAAGARLSPVWMPAAFRDGGLLDRLPGSGANWTVRGSLRAYAALQSNGGALRRAGERGSARRRDRRRAPLPAARRDGRGNRRVGRTGQWTNVMQEVNACM